MCVAPQEACSTPLPITNGLGSFRPLKCVTDKSGPVAARPPTCVCQSNSNSKFRLVQGHPLLGHRVTAWLSVQRPLHSNSALGFTYQLHF